MSGPVLSVRVLGPLEVRNEHGPVNLRGLRHQAVLARLLVAKGRVVPVDRLIDDLWTEAPHGALGAVQTFVGALRKELEPDRPPRTPARLLVTVPPGYALRLDPDAVDAWRFETAVRTSAELLAGGEAEQAWSLLDDVLGLWGGPAYAEFADEDWARTESARLDELRLLAVERRAEAALMLGRAAESVPDLRAHVAGHPLREDGWRLLALALYRTGRQGDALATLRDARRVLRRELGIDPGQALRQLETDILAQAPHLAARPARRVPAGTAAGQPGDPAVRQDFVGRAAELAELDAAAATAAAGRPRLALLSGAPGAGKTMLARILTDRLVAMGWTTAWGVSPELPGAPAAWPWTQIFEDLGRATVTIENPPAGQESDPAAARFRRQRAIAAHLRELSAKGPVLLVFDDLHWADEDTLALLTALAADTGIGPVLIVGTYRSTEISTALGEALGRAARVEPMRVYLGGLSEAQVRDLVVAATGHEPSTADARLIHVRTGGNPFFVRELLRVWESEGDAALRSVPTGVRDVIRHRMSGLGEPARTHLRQAAVIGQEIDLDVLSALSGDEDLVLESVESALRAGFLVERGGDRLWFAHALVQEALYDDVTRARRARWHTRVAEILEDTRPGDVETIAHHYVRADDRNTAGRAAVHTRAAARRAEGRGAPHEAARLWRETVSALDRSESDEPRARLEAVMGMVRALAVIGELRQARHHRADAVAAAEALGDPVLTAGVLGSFDVPGIWTANDDEKLSARIVAVAEHTLTALPGERQVERARLLITIAMERRADTGRRGREAAEEAERLARQVGDPTLLAMALNGRYFQTFHRAGLAAQRARIGEELLELSGGRAELVTFEVLGHLMLIQAGAALADLRAADRHAKAADLLADRFELPVVGVFTGWYAALRDAVAGRHDEARTTYRATAARLAGSGMSGMEEGILPLALLCLTWPTINVSEQQGADWGPYEPWVRPWLLLARGDRRSAIAAVGSIPDSPPDLLLEVRCCLHAAAAIQFGDRSAMDELYGKLRPAEGELAGAGSGILALGPVAHHLGDLSAALGHRTRALEHYRHALVISERVEAPRWVAAARDAIRRVAELSE